MRNNLTPSILEYNADCPMKQRPSRQKHLAALAAVVIAGLAYASTLMITVNGSDSDFSLDTGEFQVALPLWGTVHHTGYPLYMLLGSPFVAVLRLAGLPPAAGASVYSAAWALLAVYGVARILYWLQPDFWLALLGAVTVGLTESMWIHASIAEVYSLSLALLVAVLGLTLRLLEGWSDRLGWLLAFIGGLGVAHHRLVAVALPAVGIVLLPGWLRSGQRPAVTKWLLVSCVCFALGFLPYLDLPLRVWLGSTWNYGRPDTWAGFWYIFFGTEVKDWQKPVFDLATNLINLRDIGLVLAGELTWPGLAAAVLGLAAALWRRATRPQGRLLLGMAAALVVFSAVTRKAVLLQADLMPVAVCLLLGLALGWKALTLRWPSARRWSPILALWPAALFLQNRPAVLAVTRDPAGVNYIELFEKHLEAPEGSVVMAPWGWRYFALAYARRVENRLREWTIVDHRADFAALTRVTGRAYTAADTFFIFTASDFWAPRLGGAHLNSAGPGLVEIDRQPIPRSAGSGLVELGDGLALVDLRVGPPDEAGNVDVSVWWTATARPSHDYSTFVHVSDAEAISSSADVIAQSDHAAPVYALYPTTLWSPGELVRDDHSLSLPGDRPARLIVVGLYRRDEAGGFLNLGSVEFVKQEDRWVRR